MSAMKQNRHLIALLAAAISLVVGLALFFNKRRGNQ